MKSKLVGVFMMASVAVFAGAEEVKTELYTVVDGTMVDENTLNGFRAWRAAACDRCHGANQEGMVGPSLIERMKIISKEDFVKTLTEGRLEKGMPAFNNSEKVMSNMDNLYAYLKGRSDGAITKSKVKAIK
jgi:mono/diheme cytochrome c family protein